MTKGTGLFLSTVMQRCIKDHFGYDNIYDDASIKTLLGTNEKLYLFCGLIMAGLTTEGVKKQS